MQLTPDQIALCDQFEEFAHGLLTGNIENIGLRFTKASYRNSGDVQDKYQSYRPMMMGGDRSLSAIINGLLQTFSEAHPPEETEDQYRARRAEELRAELAKLENVA